MSNGEGTQKWTDSDAICMAWAMQNTMGCKTLEMGPRLRPDTLDEFLEWKANTWDANKKPKAVPRILSECPSEQLAEELEDGDELD
ncbi:hypothetical protein B0H10DRAFT_2059576 [Mycena sp. CBHHK59/15]|nr:hypothetical protein B0H10DRAFT_2059576 [Mycena sp. CBHHK59/15]